MATSRLSLGSRGAINFAHLPGAKRREDFVVAEFFAGSKRHRIRAMLPLRDGEQVFDHCEGARRDYSFSLEFDQVQVLETAEVPVEGSERGAVFNSQSRQVGVGPCSPPDAAIKS